MARSVTVIPATITQNSIATPNFIRKKRVAAYARVSTDFAEQLTSYEAQVDYYTRYIKKIQNGILWKCIPMKVFPLLQRNTVKDFSV